MLTGNGSLPNAVTSSASSGWGTGRTPVGGFAVEPIKVEDWRKGVMSDGCPSCERTEVLCDDCLNSIREETANG